MSNLNVHIIASSSSGNCIIVEDSGSKIMLDCGLSYNKIAKQVRVSEVECVLVTHCHLDHYRAAPELIRRGVEVYMSRGTADEKGVWDARIAESLRQIETDNWYILPFDIEHDVPEPLGFLFENKTSGKKYLYVVDSATIEYDFTGVNVFIIEANYDEAILNESEHPDWLKDRIRQSHFSLEGLKRFLGSSDLSKAEEIYLVHLSDSNSDEKKFIQEIEALTGVPVYTDSSMYPEKANVASPSP